MSASSKVHPTLKEAHLENYREHPAFRFGDPALVLRGDLQAEFAGLYRQAESFGRTLTQEAQRSLCSRIVGVLGAIFDDLDGQAGDQCEAQFMAELRQEASRLLLVELEWYYRSRSAAFVRLETAVGAADIACMMQERHIISALPRAAVDEILDISHPELAVFRQRAASMRLTREDLSVNAGPVVGRIRRVLDREFQGLGVLDAVGAYTGRPAHVSGVALELSVPRAGWWEHGLDDGAPPATLYAHLDESIASPKSIVYLTDVGEENGPTSIFEGGYEALELQPLQELIGRVIGIVGNASESPLHSYYAKRYHQSMTSERFRRHYMRLPEAMRFNSHLGWDVLATSRLEAGLVARERKMLGPAGTFIAFDGGRLLHRGGLVRSGERVALQVVFSNESKLEKLRRRLRRVLS